MADQQSPAREEPQRTDQDEEQVRGVGDQDRDDEFDDTDDADEGEADEEDRDAI